MTLLEIETELARETNKNASSLDTTTKARFLAAINRHYKRIASFPGLQHLRDTTTTFPSVAGQAAYQIASVAKIKRIWDTTNQRRLLPMSMDQYRRISPQAITDNQGTPLFWVWGSGSGTSTPKFDLYLYQTPSSVITYTCDITSVLTLLANDNDVPILPLDFHDLLFLGALVDEYRHLDDSRLTVVVQQMNEREKQFKYWMHETDDGATTISDLGQVLPSQLGPAFPSGS
jgi:hypothetical protein